MVVPSTDHDIIIVTLSAEVRRRRVQRAHRTDGAPLAVAVVANAVRDARSIHRAVL